MFRRFLLAPDSFKGTLEAAEVCEIFAEAIRSEVPDAQIAAIPMADGGEGMTETYLKLLGGARISVQVTGPLGAPVEGFYGRLNDGSAVIEMAAAAGLPLAGEVRDPLNATSFGVGELIRHAVEHGAQRILLGLGGSATNDLGVGMAAALGWRFLDATGAGLVPLAKNLGRVARILPPEKALPCAVTAACDVRNPLLGDDGATAVYGPQKGVTAQLRPILEAGIGHVSEMLEDMLGMELRNVPGAGAAGGMGAGVLAFLGGSLKPGIELILDAVDFDARLRHADVVFTGEGRMDRQSANGKVPMGVGLRCRSAGVPCVALCGSLGEGAEELRRCGVTACFSAVRGETDFARIRESCREDLYRLTRSVVRLMNAGT